MWAAVLLPPYLRDRNESRAGGSGNTVRTRIDALTSSFSGKSSYLPVQASGQSASQVPLPHGAKQPIGVAPVAAESAETMPQSSAVQILGPAGGSVQSPDGVELLLPEGALPEKTVVSATR